MGFKVIAGTFHVKGYSPDGDSVRFKPNNINDLAQLIGSKAKVNSLGHVQLRLEAIDTLETHYQDFYQPRDLAESAMNHLLKALQIDGVMWNDKKTKIISANDGTPGFIISREIEKNGRPVSFAYVGSPPVTNVDANIFVDESLIKASVNTEMLASGLAYPTYYTGIFSDLREYLTSVVSQARQNSNGVWSRDVTNKGFDVTSLVSITEDNVILPKLFRRLINYLEGGGTGKGFKAYLENLRENVMIISAVHSTHFDNVIEERDNNIRMTEPPENLIFAG